MPNSRVLREDQHLVPTGNDVLKPIHEEVQLGTLFTGEMDITKLLQRLEFRQGVRERHPLAKSSQLCNRFLESLFVGFQWTSFHLNGVLVELWFLE